MSKSTSIEADMRERGHASGYFSRGYILSIKVLLSQEFCNWNLQLKFDNIFFDEKSFA